MATLRAPEFSAGIPEGIAPLSTAEEQAGILRGIGRKRPDGASLVLDGGLRIEPWERVLLHREARRSRDLRDVKGTALTLLRARAAEWAILRRLEAPDIDLKAAESASLLLDRTLSDIGSATDLDDENHAGFDSIAERLHVLYDRVAATSLRLAMARPVDPAELAVADLGEDFFELVQLGEHRPVPREIRLHAVPALEVEVEDDAFEIEAGDLERAPSAPPASLSVPSPLSDLDGIDGLDGLDGLDLTFAVGEPVVFAADPEETTEVAQTTTLEAAVDEPDEFAAYDLAPAAIVTVANGAIDSEVALVAVAPPEYEPVLAPEPYPVGVPEPLGAPLIEPEVEPDVFDFHLAPQAPTGRDEIDLFPPLPATVIAPMAAEAEIAPMAPVVRESAPIEKAAPPQPAAVAAPAVVVIAPRTEAKRTSPLLYIAIAAVVIAIAVAALLLR